MRSGEDDKEIEIIGPKVHELAQVLSDEPGHAYGSKCFAAKTSQARRPARVVVIIEGSKGPLDASVPLHRQSVLMTQKYRM